MPLTLAVCMMLIAGITTGQFAGNNIAFRKDATQLPGDYCEGSFCYTASLAVDGVVDNDGRLLGHCSHTTDNLHLNASWEVSFRGLYQITGIRVFNRKSNYCEDPFCFTGSLAVDGKVDSDGRLRRHCSHTVDNSHFNASWNVSFRGLYQITGIRIFNRKSTNDGLIFGKRLRNFSVIGINSDNDTELLLYTDNYTFIDENYKVKTEIPLPNAPSVTEIRIEIPNRGDKETTVLTLCEVKVFSDFVCPNLTIDDNTIIAYTNFTNNGSVASFSCVPGYYLPQNNYTLVCQVYQWSGPPLSCEQVYCSLPSNISNGGYSISDRCASLKQNNSLPYICSVSLFCNKGFNLTERIDWVCLENGSWSGKEPVCQIVMCILPEEDQNGIQLKASFSNGSSIPTKSVSCGTEIHIFCDVGFKTSTEIKLTCKEDGSWSGTTPVCNVVTCDHPGNNSPINGTYTDMSEKLYLSGKKIYSHTIKVLCHTGYIVTSGSETRTCQDNGTWSGTDPVCIIVKCSPLEKVEGVFYEYSFNYESSIYHLNSTVNIGCVNGMIPDGSKVRRCVENGTWDGILSTCNAASPSSTPRAALIGGVTGAFVVLLIVTVSVVVVIIMRRRKHKTEEPSYFSSLQRQQNEGDEYDNIGNADSYISTTENKRQAYSNVVADPNGREREYENA